MDDLRKVGRDEIRNACLKQSIEHKGLKEPKMVVAFVQTGLQQRNRS